MSVFDERDLHLADLNEQLSVLMTAQKGYEEIFLSTSANRTDIVLLARKNLKVCYASPSCRPILGYDQQDLIGTSCLDLIHPDDLPHAIATFFSIAGNGDCETRVEFRLLHRDGGTVFIEAVGKYMDSYLDAGGIIIHLRNITGQKRSEQATFEQKQFYEAILNSIYDGVCVTDSDDVITFINRGFCTTMGMPAESIIGKKILPGILTLNTQYFQHHYSTARNSLAPVNFESILVTTSAEVSIFLTGWCIPRQTHGRFTGMICTFTNITEQQMTKERLSESEIRFRSTAETATDGIITVNGSGKVVFWNTAASHIFGYAELEVMGRDIYQIIPREVITYHENIFSDAAANRNMESIGRTVEGRARRKDGRAFPIELSLASWKIDSEIHFTAIIRDITQRKRIEQSLYNSEQELNNLSSRLLYVHEQERKRISYELHDGLGQLLSAVKITAKSMLSQGLHAQQGSEAKTATPDVLLGTIQAAIDEVRRISRDLRPSILDDLGMVTAIQAFCHDFELLNPAITVKNDIHSRDDEIPEQLKIIIYRVLQEACTNIVRHSRADAITVSLYSKEGIQLAVHDNGTGFEVQRAFLKKGPRRGLGLSSMRERVEYSGGAFSIQSGPGGTTVRASWG